MIKFFPPEVKQRVMLDLLLAESALETVPKQLWSHPSVVKRAKSLGKKPGETLLDRTYHHRAMIHLENDKKRGRPDIAHFSLLEALGTPLNREGLLRVHIHTVDDHVIYIDPKVRLPRNYDRFVGLIEQLYKEGKVPTKGQPLLRLEKGSLKDVLSEIRPSYVIAFTRKGEAKTLESAVGTLSEKNTAAIVGAFPHGHFSEETTKLADLTVSIDPEMLEAWTVTSRVIYEFEKLIGLPERRWEKNTGESWENERREDSPKD